MENVPKNKSLYKALTLLEFLSENEYELGITELSKKSGLQKSTVHDIISTFMLAGFVEQNPSNNKYHLGRKLSKLSNSYVTNNTLKDKIQLIIRHLANKTEQTVFYGIPYGEEVLYICSAYTKNSFNIAPITGVVAPLYCTGIGKAILAFSDKTTIDSICNKQLEPFTEKTITNPIKLKEDLIITKKRGYSIDDCEHEHGIKCIGMPIIHNDILLGAISISGYEAHFSEEKINFYVACLHEAISLICF